MYFICVSVRCICVCILDRITFFAADCEIFIRKSKWGGGPAGQLTIFSCVTAQSQQSPDSTSITIFQTCVSNIKETKLETSSFQKVRSNDHCQVIDCYLTRQIYIIILNSDNNYQIWSFPSFQRWEVDFSMKNAKCKNKKMVETPICPILLSAAGRLGQIRNRLLNGGFALSCFNLFSHLAHIVAQFKIGL